jgi:cytochrome c553
MAAAQVSPGWMSFAAIAAGLAASPGHAAGDRALGEYLSSECVTCHLGSAHKANGIPALHGMPADQFTALMTTYRRGDRDNAAMRNVAEQLSDQDIAALAAYYEGLKAAP